MLHAGLSILTLFPREETNIFIFKGFLALKEAKI